MVRHGTLRRKLFRDMGREAMQFLAMILLCALGTWVFAGLDAAWRMQELTIETYFSEQNLCDLWIRSASFAAQDIARVRSMPEVETVVPRITMEADAPDLPGKVRVEIQAVRGRMLLNTPVLREGQLLSPGNVRECLIEEQFARAQGLKPGNQIRMELGGMEIEFTICGIVLSPEYLITSNDMAPDPSRFGYILVNAEAFGDMQANSMLVRLKDRSEIEQVKRRISEQITGSMIITQDNHASTVSGRNYINLFQKMSYLFPVLAYFVAALMVVTTISRLVESQRIQMGTLKALGYSNGKIRRHYMLYALLPSSAGSLAGLITAQYTIPQIIWRMLDTNLRTPSVLQPEISAISIALAAAEVGMSFLICMIHVNRSLRESTAELLRPKPPRSGERLLLERIGWVWSRMSFNSKMVLRNLLRNKGRSTLSLIGMLFCNMLIICSFGLQESIPYFIGVHFERTIGYDQKLELKADASGSLDAWRGRIDAERVDGLMEVSVNLISDSVSRSCVLTVMPDDMQLLRIGDQQTVMHLPEEGVVLSEKLAEVMGVSVGDRLEAMFPGTREKRELTVEAIARVNIGQSAYLGEEAWRRLRMGDFSVSALLIRNPSAMGRSQIDQSDEINAVREPSDQHRQALRIMDSASAAFSLLSGVALGLAFVICYNMGLLSFMERKRDYATLKVLGYHQREIRGLVFRENNLISLLGVAAGIVPGILLVQIILKMCEFDSMIFTAHVSIKTVVLSSMVSFAFGMLIQMFLTRKVRRIDMVEALKSVE